MWMGLLVAKNIRKNMRHFGLYIFSIIFGSALLMAFATMRNSRAMVTLSGESNAAYMGITVVTVLLTVIVALFLLQANSIFIKQRAKEVGLLQSIGLTKGQIFQSISIEFGLIYFLSAAIGCALGFFFSRLLTLVLFRLMRIEMSVQIEFSMGALLFAVYVFVGIFILMSLYNGIFLKRQSILSLFTLLKRSEHQEKPMAWWQMVLGVIGLIMIIAGYYISSDMINMMSALGVLALAVPFIILFLVIVGTYLLFRTSIEWIGRLISKSKQGYLALRDVLSLSSMMFRMKKNAFTLTVITTVTAVAIGFLSFGYISYYGIDKQLAADAPNHFVFEKAEEEAQFARVLTEAGIAYEQVDKQMYTVNLDISNMYDAATLTSMVSADGKQLVYVVNDAQVPDVDVQPGEMILEMQTMEKMANPKSKVNVSWEYFYGTMGGAVLEQHPLYLRDIVEAGTAGVRTFGIRTIAILDEADYMEIKNQIDNDPAQAKYIENGPRTTYRGIELANERDLSAATDLFHTTFGTELSGDRTAQQDRYESMMSGNGLTMFLISFLGLTFLVTSGCILYFKQVDEAEGEKPSYTILQKLGFSLGDFTSGIGMKQVVNFGIPLLVGLLHSYFAVRAGWFLFGNEMWTPMIIVMVLYAVLYSLFALLSLSHNKHVVKQARVG
jgi:bacitracin transport system permease protein